MPMLASINKDDDDEDADLAKALLLSMQTAQQEQGEVSDELSQQTYGMEDLDSVSDNGSDLHSNMSGKPGSVKLPPVPNMAEPDEKDVELVMSQAACNRVDAIETLKANGHDIVEAVWSFQKTQERGDSAEERTRNVDKADIKSVVSSSGSSQGLTSSDSNDVRSISTFDSNPSNSDGSISTLKYKSSANGSTENDDETEIRSTFTADTQDQMHALMSLDDEQILDDTGPSYQGNSLVEAAEFGDAAAVELLLNVSDTDVNQLSWAGEVGKSNGKTALYIASENGSASIVRLILAHPDIDPNFHSWVSREPPFNDPFAARALEAAGDQNHFDVVELLAEHPKIDTERINAQLYMQTCFGRLEVVNALFKHPAADANGHPGSADYRMPPLVGACQIGRLDMVQVFLERDGIDVNLTTHDGHTPLYKTCETGHLNILDVLLRRPDVLVNKPTDKGRTPLFAAAMLGKIEVVEKLLEHDQIAVNHAAHDGTTPFFIACGSGYLDIVLKLLERTEIDVNQGSHTGVSPLYTASQQGHTEIVRKLLEQPGILVNKADTDGVSPLLAAAGAGHLKIVQMLLERTDIEPRKTNNQDGTALHGACQEGYPEVVRELLKQDGIRVNKPLFNGLTALTMASWNGHLEIVQQLLARKEIDVNFGTYDRKMTPLYQACADGHLAVVRSLLAHEKTEVNKRGEIGTPLNIACGKNNVEILRELLKHKDIDVNARDVGLVTPLMTAVRYGYADIFNALLEHETIDVNTAVGGSNTALTFACQFGRTAFVQKLLERPDLNFTSYSQVAGERAASNGHDAIVQLLIEYSVDGSAFLFASRKGNSATFKTLLGREGTDVNQQNSAGETALVLASESGHVDIVQQILDYKVPIVKGSNVKLLSTDADSELPDQVDYFLDGALEQKQWGDNSIQKFSGEPAVAEYPVVVPGEPVSAWWVRLPGDSAVVAFPSSVLEVVAPSDLDESSDTMDTAAELEVVSASESKEGSHEASGAKNEEVKVGSVCHVWASNAMDCQGVGKVYRQTDKKDGFWIEFADRFDGKENFNIQKEFKGKKLQRLKLFDTNEQQRKELDRLQRLQKKKKTNSTNDDDPELVRIGKVIASMQEKYCPEPTYTKSPYKILDWIHHSTYGEGKVTHIYQGKDGDVICVKFIKPDPEHREHFAHRFTPKNYKQLTLDLNPTRNADGFWPGDTVEVRDVEILELNGLVGTIHCPYPADLDRWVVKLHQGPWVHDLPIEAKQHFKKYEEGDDFVILKKDNLKSLKPRLERPDIDLPRKDGSTALLVASERGHLEIVQKLQAALAMSVQATENN